MITCRHCDMPFNPDKSRISDFGYCSGLCWDMNVAAKLIAERAVPTEPAF